MQGRVIRGFLPSHHYRGLHPSLRWSCSPEGYLGLGRTNGGPRRAASSIWSDVPQTDLPDRSPQTSRWLCHGYESTSSHRLTLLWKSGIARSPDDGDLCDCIETADIDFSTSLRRRERWQ